MTLRAKIIFILIPVTLLAVMGVVKLKPWQTESDDGPATAGPRSVPVEVVTVARSEYRGELIFNGSLLAQHSIAIRSELSGRLESVSFSSGADVQAGDVLAKLDTQELEARKRAQQHELTLAESNLTRFASLFESGGYTERDLAQAISRREILAAGLDELEALIDKATLRAPFNGTLGLRMVSPGQIIEASTLLTTLQDLDRMYLDFVVPERNSEVAKVGREVIFTAANADRTHTATVQAIDPQVDRETRSLVVRAVVDNVKRELLPGNYARVQVPIIATDVIVVPSVSIVRSLGSVSVYVLESGKAVRTEVTVGRR